MAAEVFDRLRASVPVNRQAGLALARGEHWTPRNRMTIERWSTPPKMKTVPANTPNQIGRQIGRLRCVGLLDAPAGKYGLSWVMRCSCGDYEIRKAKAINNPENTNDMCHACRHLQYVKARGSEEKKKWR